MLTKDLGYGDTSETKLLLQEASKLLQAYSQSIQNSESWLLYHEYLQLRCGMK